MLQKQHNTQTTTDQQLWTKQEIEPLPFFIEGGVCGEQQKAPTCQNRERVSLWQQPQPTCKPLHQPTTRHNPKHKAKVVVV